MAFKAEFELEFPSEAEAKKAFSVLNKDLKTIKGVLKTRRAGKRIFATAESDSFTGVRALSTSFLRSGRVACDVLDAVAGRVAKAAAEEEDLDSF